MTSRTDYKARGGGGLRDALLRPAAGAVGGLLARGRNVGALGVAVVEPVGGHTGMDYYDFGLCKGLSEAGARVTLYTCDETSGGPTGGYEVRLPYRAIYGDEAAWLRGLRYLRGSVRTLLGARLDRARIAHFHFFHVGPLEMFNVLLARLLGLKVVVTAHDVQSFVERLSVPWMVRRAYGLAGRVIAHSRIGAGELRTVLGVPESKIDTIPHGSYLDLVGEMPPQGEARARLGLPATAPVLLFFGQIKEVKGLDVLLEAMPRLVREHPGTTLLVAGKVWKDDFGRYAGAADALGVAENCVFHIRYIPDSEVADYYAAADVVVLPYRRIYQSGVLLMAMSYGKPVVVSDIEGMTEIAADGENGYVFPSENPEALAQTLARVISAPEEARDVGRRALLHMQEHHDWGRIGRLTLASYRSALGER